MNTSVVMVACLAMTIAVVLFLLFRASFRLTIVAWTTVFFLVPVWVGVSVGLPLRALTVVTIMGLAAWWCRLRWRLPDALLGLVVVLTVVGTGLGLISVAVAATVVVDWIPLYIWGRVVGARGAFESVGRALSVGAIVVSVLAIVEFLTETNPFVLMPFSGLGAEVWRPLQYRGGLLRVEGAFGHSIALGCVLSMCASFVLTRKWPVLITVMALTPMSVAVVLTSSRTAMATFVLTIALTLVLSRVMSPLTKVVLVASGIGATFFTFNYVVDLLGGADAEASRSAEHRSNIWELAAFIRSFGRADEYVGAISGDLYFGGSYARSIDNAILVLGLWMGWIPLAILVVCYVTAALQALRPSRTSPELIALLGQAPALVTVALITQYGALFWFLGGLAVARAGVEAAPRPRRERRLEAEVLPSSPLRQQRQ